MNVLPTGLYRPGGSLLHRLRADVKLIALLLLAAAVCFAKSGTAAAVMVLFLLALIFLSRLPATDVFRPLWNLKWFFLTVLVMNLLFFSPETAFAHWWIFAPSAEGLRQGLLVCLRVAVIIGFSVVLNAVTSPREMTAALERLLYPLRHLKLPVGQLAMILTVAVQFIPTLSQEADTIRKAQTARGARFDSRRFSQRAVALLPLVVPVFLAAFRRADELSLAMEARGYRTDVTNPPAKASRLTTGDFAAILFPILLLAVAILF